MLNTFIFKPTTNEALLISLHNKVVTDHLILHSHWCQRERSDSRVPLIICVHMIMKPVLLWEGGVFLSGLLTWAMDLKAPDCSTSLVNTLNYFESHVLRVRSWSVFSVLNISLVSEYQVQGRFSSSEGAPSVKQTWHPSDELYSVSIIFIFHREQIEFLILGKKSCFSQFVWAGKSERGDLSLRIYIYMYLYTCIQAVNHMHLHTRAYRVYTCMVHMYSCKSRWKQSRAHHTHNFEKQKRRRNSGGGGGKSEQSGLLTLPRAARGNW